MQPTHWAVTSSNRDNCWIKKEKSLVFFRKTLCLKLKDSADSAEKEKNRPTLLIHIDTKLLNKIVAE